MEAPSPVSSTTTEHASSALISSNSLVTIQQFFSTHVGMSEPPHSHKPVESTFAAGRKEQSLFLLVAGNGRKPTEEVWITLSKPLSRSRRKNY